jgi:CDP-ribitol ribitolphosphotransferase
MAFFSPDLDEYDDWRGFYYDYEELTPGPIFTETDALVDWVADVDERFDRDAMHAFRERFMCACDGHATERILDCLFSLK